MRILIACYSFTGNTMTVAEILADKLGAKLTRVEPVKDRWYVIKAIQAFRETKVPIKECETDLNDFDCLIVCSPVWAGRIPPGVREFLSQVKNVEGKKCAALVTMGGNGKEGATTQIMFELENKGMINMGICKITGADQKSGSWSEKVDEFLEIFNKL
jgi:flavodoxin